MGLINQKKEQAGDPLSNLSRQQLMELLLEQTKEVERLREENASITKALEESKGREASYREDLDHAFSLLRLTMRLEKAIKKLDPEFVPEPYDPKVNAMAWDAACAQADNTKK